MTLDWTQNSSSWQNIYLVLLNNAPIYDDQTTILTEVPRVSHALSLRYVTTCYISNLYFIITIVEPAHTVHEIACACSSV